MTSILDAAHSKITNVKLAGSYNWIDAPTPTILCPGTPPLWKPLEVAEPVLPDSGYQFVDQNADRNPGAPLEALLQAVHSASKVDLLSINVITDSAPLRRLLGFADRRFETPGKAAFSFTAETIGNTTLFTKNSTITREPAFVQGNNAKHQARGYRDMFLKKYSRIHAVALGARELFCILKYEFAGLNFLVRHGVDGYRRDFETDDMTEFVTLEDASLEAIVENSKSLRLDGNLGKELEGVHVKEVAVQRGGNDVPHKAMFELITRSKYTNFDLDERLPDLWISQTQNFITAKYTKIPKSPDQAVHFSDNLRPEHTGNTIKHWEENNTKATSSLAGLCKQIVETVKSAGKPCRVSYNGNWNESLLIEPVERDAQLPTISYEMRDILKGQRDGRKP